MPCEEALEIFLKEKYAAFQVVLQCNDLPLGSLELQWLFEDLVR